MFKKLLSKRFLVPLIALSAPSYSMLAHRKVNSPNELSTEDISKQTLVCYQKTGNSETDELVYQILEQFMNQYRALMSEDFEIVLIQPPSQRQQGMEPELMIFRAEDYGFLPLKKHIKVKEYSKLFKRMNKQINFAQEVGSQNIQEILEVTNNRNTPQLFICPQSYTKEGLKKTKKYLKDFMKSNQYIASEVRTYIVRDQDAMKALKLDMASPNKVYILAPKNNNLLQRNSQKFHKIGGKSYAIISTEQEQGIEPKSILEKFVFPPFLKKSHPNTLILKITINLNQDSEETLKKIYKEMGKLTGVSKVLNFKHDELEGESKYVITVQRNNFDQLVSIYQPNCKYPRQQKQSLLSQSHTWRYTGDLNADNIKDWIQQISRGNIQQYYKSEPPQDQRQSKRIVGEEYLKIINKNDETIVFHYSKSCFSCKKFAKTYQNVAEEVQSWQKPISFYKIDNDQNKIEGLRNYNSTPIFVMYRKWNGQVVPFIFKNIFFNKTLFKDFIEITRSVKLIEQEKLQTAIQTFRNSQNLIKQFL